MDFGELALLLAPTLFAVGFCIGFFMGWKLYQAILVSRADEKSKENRD